MSSRTATRKPVDAATAELLREANTPRYELTEVAISEAARGDGSSLDLTVIRAGFNSSQSRYYTAEALRSGAAVFGGLKMYANHQTRSEEQARPEGDVWQWVASLTNVAFDEATQSLRGTAQVVDPAFRDKLALLDEAGQLTNLGVSIRAIGTGEAGALVEGVKTFRVDEFAAGISVDFVTEAGAGGYVEFRESADAVGVLTLTLASLRERRPDLVAALIHEHEQQHEEADMSDEELRAATARAEAAETALAAERAATATAENARAAAESALAETQAAEALRTAQVEIGRLISESGLPDPAIERLRTSLATVTSTEAATAEIASMRSLVESVTGKPTGAVRGNGGGTEGKPAGTSRSLEESFARVPGATEADVKLAAAGGR